MFSRARRADTATRLRRRHRSAGSLESGEVALVEGAPHVLAREAEPLGSRPAQTRAATRDELTAQELQIALLARDGLSHAEIGAQLFLSPRTVEWHLRKVFAKLGIRSRTRIANALPRPRA